MLSLPKPIYQNQQLGQMMIKRPGGPGLLGLRSQHCCRLQLDLIAGLSLGCEKKKRQFCWQVLLVCKLMRAEESGMSHVLWVRVWRGLTVHFIKTHPWRWSWTFGLAAVLTSGTNDTLRWVSLTGRLLNEGTNQFLMTWAPFFSFTIVSVGDKNTGGGRFIVRWSDAHKIALIVTTV